MRHLLPLTALALLSCTTEQRSPAPPKDRALEALTAARRILPAQLQEAAFPERATKGLHIGSGDAWLEITPRGARDVKPSVVEGASVYVDAVESTDVIYAQTTNAVEDLRVAHTLAAAQHPAWELRLGPAIARVEVHDGKVQAFDRSDAIRIASAPAFAIDAHGEKRPITFALHGSSLEGTLDTAGLALPITIDPAWTVLASMKSVRIRGAAARLASGKVIAIGGGDPKSTSTAELYDPVANTWTSTKGNMAFAHDNFIATPFAGGAKVLVTGTVEGGGSGGPPPGMSTAEIYDSTSDGFTQSVMPVASKDHTATVLADGRVALIGGNTGGGSAANPQIRIYNPATGVWGAGATYPVVNHAALLLPSGQVLITGGFQPRDPMKDPTLKISDSVVTWDPTTGLIDRKMNLPTSRHSHAMVRLTAGANAGKIMVFAGQVRIVDETTSVPSPGSALWDPTTNTWSLGPFLHTTRSFFGWSEMAGGRILVTGGAPDLTSPTIVPYGDAELYDPTANAWLLAGSMSGPRAAHIQVTLASGNEAIVGGGISSVKEGFFEFSLAAEKFTLQAVGGACAAAGQCLSGFCVDGVCCDTACNGQCAACDVTGSVGTCTAVTGAPHGTRTLCDPTKSGDVCASACNGTDTAACHFPGATVTCGVNGCAAGTETHASACDGGGKCGDVPKSCGDYVCDSTACKTSCTVKADCVNPSDFCESGKCVRQQPNGVACTRDEACATGFCIDGTCCESKCDGQCQACDVPGQAGKCVAVAGKPHGTRAACATDTNACGSKICDGSNTASCAGTPACGNYGCDKSTLVCKSSCANNADCASGFECKDGTCVPQTSKCSSDLTQLISTDGTKADCAPYICRDGGCLPSCKSSSDCQGGFTCDASEKCVAPAAADSGSSGGCSYGGRSSSSLFVLALALAGVLARRRG